MIDANDYLFTQLKDGETELEYLWRLGQAKDNGLINIDWNDVADLINKAFRSDESEYRTEASYRKPYQQANRFYLAGIFNKFSEEEYLKWLEDAKYEIRKEKYQMHDERVARNRIEREEARRISMVDIVKSAIDTYKPINFDYTPNHVKDSDKDLIIHLTDIHYGVDIDTPLNKCNSDIIADRLKLFLDEIADAVELYKPQKAYLIIGGDLIQGLIHLNARLEAKEHIVDQIIHVSDLVSNFIFELSKMFQSVEVHSTAGNHSRVTESKEHTSHGENFDMLVPYTCKKDLKNVENVHFVDNYLDYDIANFTVRGWNVYATHGDKDTQKSVVYNMTKFARKARLPLPDMCYLGHRHKNGYDTVDDVKVIESGCVDGMDNYAISKRLVGMPEQTITVVTEQNRIKALIDVQLY